MKGFRLYMQLLMDSLVYKGKYIRSKLWLEIIVWSIVSSIAVLLMALYPILSIFVISFFTAFYYKLVLRCVELNNKDDREDLILWKWKKYGKDY